MPAPALAPAASAEATPPRWRRALAAASEATVLIIFAFGVSYLLALAEAAPWVRTAVAAVLMAHVAAWHLVPRWRALCEALGAQP